MTQQTGLTSAGFYRERLDVILARLTASVQGIYGPDLVLDGSTQDGQLLGIYAESVSDLAQVIEDVYASFDPSQATGQALFRLGLLSGIVAQIGQKATVTLTVHVKQGETLYAGAQVQDVDTGVIYTLNANVGPSAGDSHAYTTTATAQIEGTVASAAGKVTKIVIPVYGWLSVTNAAPSTTGTSTETQEAFRERRNASVATPAQGILDGLYGALSNLSGIGSVQVFNNPTSAWTSIKGSDLALPPNSCRVVVANDLAAIATAIWRYKSPGCGYYGTAHTVTDTQGQTQSVPYTVATPQPLEVAVYYTAIEGQGFVVGQDEAKIKAALETWVAANHVPGQDVAWSHFFAPVLESVPGKTMPSAIKIETLLFRPAGTGSSYGQNDYVMPWDHIATCSAANVLVFAV